MWYVASYPYLCSALTAMRLLKRLRAASAPFPFPVDFVATFVPEDLDTRPARDLLDAWAAEEGGKVRNFTSLKRGVKDSYYRATYQKFHSFLLTEYERVVVMDADGFAVRSLDDLFLVRMGEGARLAAPQGYWFKREGVTTGWQKGGLG